MKPAAVRFGLTCTAALAIAGCVRLEAPEFREEDRLVPSCDRDLDCGRGRCDLSLYRCVAAMPKFPGLLLDIVPEAVDLGFGGFHFQTDLNSLAIDSEAPAALELQQPPNISGRIGLVPEPCSQLPSVRVTFVPRLTHLGLALGRYTTVSKRTIGEHSSTVEHTYKFDGLPTGNYDVYFADAGDVKLTDPECEVVPQLFRNFEVKLPMDLPLLQAAEDVRHLQVLIPWTEQLEGWSVDVVHSVTGEVLSTRRPISAEVVRDVLNTTTGAREFAIELKVADVQGSDYVNSTEAMLLRLSPPTGVARPTILFSLFALMVVTPNVAQLAPLGRFEDAVQFSAWVLQDTVANEPIQGVVEFDALELSGTQGQGRLEFVVSATIGEGGLVAAALPPGMYRARVRPNDLESATFDTLVRVWALSAGSSGGAQAAIVIAVPKGPSITGRVRVPYPDVSAQGTEIQALGLTVPSLGKTFRPRSASALASASGRFALEGLDCGACTSENPVRFTLRAKPPAVLGLPWAIESRASVAGGPDGDAVVDFSLSFPAVHFGLLSFRKRNDVVGAFPGVLIRALALVDQDGRVLPVGTQSCFEQPTGAVLGERCAIGTVEVAQARSGSDGAFQLLLPTNLTEFGR